MLPLGKQHHKIFVAALDWGWGHVTRSTALVQKLLDEGKEVVVGGSGVSGEFFKKQFPDLQYYDLPGYAFTFDDTKNVYWQMMRKIPEISSVMNQEVKALKEIHQVENFDTIISDHRYGLRLEGLYNVVVCHQLNLQAGNYSRIVNALHHSLLHKFDAIWVPDNAQRTLSGKLSHTTAKLEDKVTYIGRLSTIDKEQSSARDIELLIILTGPEPQRTRFESTLSTIFTQINFPVYGTIIQGTDESQVSWAEEFNIVAITDREKTEHYIRNARKIITRSGYSSIMDLYPFDVPTLLVPTPNQTEQEYLAEHVRKMKNVSVFQQSELNKDIISGFLKSK